VKIGLCTIAFARRALDDVLAMAAEDGFDGVEIWGKEPHAGAYDQVALSATRNQAQSLGIEICCFGSYMMPLEQAATDLVALSEEGLKITHELGAPMVRIWAPYVTPDQLPPDQYDLAVVEIRDFCGKAAELGIVVVIEFHDSTIAERSEDLLRLIDDVAASNLKAHWQPSFRADAENLYESLENLIPNLAHVHAQNFRASYGNRTQLADGDVDYRKVVGMLKEAGYDGYIQVEFVGKEKPDEWARRDCNFLKELVTR